MTANAARPTRNRSSTWSVNTSPVPVMIIARLPPSRAISLASGPRPEMSPGTGAELPHCGYAILTT